MNKRMKYWVAALFGIVFMISGCQSEIFPTADIGKGYIDLDFSVSVPDMEDVITRAVDPDGGGVQNITLFCFDKYGLFVSTVTANITDDGESISLKGSFTAKVPDHVKIVHVVGNQNLTYFEEGEYANMSEVEVMTSIQASAGRMIYWARKDVSELTSGAAVELLRNQAKFTVNVASASGFNEKGWVVLNTNAFGTVAPYNSQTGAFVPPTIDNPFVTSPLNSEKLKSYFDVRIEDEEYFFETENTVDDPVDMIIKGSHGSEPELYYRISIMDENGSPVMIMRNHHYIVNIVGPLSYGQNTFEEALTAPATNNVWVSVSDNVKTVYDDGSRLSVDQTFVVLCEQEFTDPNTYSLTYTIENLSGGSPEKAQVYWLEGNNVAKHEFDHVFTSDGKGTITVDLLDMGSEVKREGTLFISSGRLHRKIKVVTVKEQSFDPAWITTNIYGIGTGENVTMMFTIPETCPDELLPLEVLISSEELDIRNESGMALPIRRAGEEGYGEDNGIGYKYVLNVTEKGTQRVYLETILEQSASSTVQVTIEADHFKTLSKTATFQTAIDQRILVHNLRSYVANQPADEAIYYYLVPQKKNAIVEFPTHLGKNVVYDEDFNVVSYESVTPGANDEFLLYSQYLNHNTSSTDLNFDFYPVSESNWSTGGRVYGFVRNSTGEPSEAIFHMITNSSRSAEVVRIASNPYGSPSVRNPSNDCLGNQYKSAVFELANFHPFHFAATVNGVGTAVTGDNIESVETVELSYVPGQEVNVEFDITSFTSSMRNNEGGIFPIDQQVSVDPFGTSFKVYIDAPMLEINDDKNSLPASKFYEESEGRFVYVVDADRDAERIKEGSTKWGNASVSDTRTQDYIGNDISVDQTGERKTLPFKTKTIVSDGDIVISSEEDVVVYYKKNFNIINEAITGTIRFGTESDNQFIPSDVFVPFEVLPTFNRIGVMSIGANGVYNLRLRKEYEYNWNTDDVKLQYMSDGITYEKVFDSLSEFYSSKDILLTPAQ